MTSALITVAPKLGKLIPLLGSDKDGEVVAAAAAITRTLKQAGADWHDVAAAVARTEPPGPVEPVSWRHIPLCERGMWLAEMAVSGLLSPWEQNFCSSILAQVRFRSRITLSAKQVAVLDGCISKIIGEERS